MLNIGIIGAGRIGKVHLESISYHVKNATVKAVADPFMNDGRENLYRLSEDFRRPRNRRGARLLFNRYPRRHFHCRHKCRQTRVLRKAGRPLRRQDSGGRRRARKTPRNQISGRL